MVGQILPYTAANPPERAILAGIMTRNVKSGDSVAHKD
jgi:hypothetical protein